MHIKAAAGWGAVAISVIAMAIFATCLVLAFLVHDERRLDMLVGAAISAATTAVQFWLGSSSSSQKKDETIADAAAAGQALSAKQEENKGLNP